LIRLVMVGDSRTPQHRLQINMVSPGFAGTAKGLMNKAALLNVAAWALALGLFGLAMILSYREIHYSVPNDLRSPAVLLVNALLATAVAFGFAVREGSLTRWVDIHLCFRFGFWTAAVFRLIPPFINEQVLYIKNTISFDVPYIILGAFIHGGLTFLLASPFAVQGRDRSTWTPDKSLSEMCMSAILIFFIAAVIVRLLAEPALLNP
jgi:hypothetical protein